jgi:hypothetical protein
MRLFIIFFSAIALLTGCVHNQTAESDSFTEKLIRFRYSLYKDLKGLDSQEINELMKTGYSNHVIGSKCEAFYSENREQIKAYQRSILAGKSGTVLDLHGVVKDQDIDKYLRSGPLSTTELWEKIAEDTDEPDADLDRAYTVMKFITINPIQRVDFIISMLVTHLFSVEWVGTLYMKNTLGSPLISTKELRVDYWEIIIDQYEWVFFFEFDVKEDVLYLKEVGKRP